MCFHELAVYNGPPRMLVFSRSDMGKRCDCPFFLHPLFVIVNPNPASQASVVQYRLIHRKNHSTVTSYSLIAILHHLFFLKRRDCFCIPLYIHILEHVPELLICRLFFILAFIIAFPCEVLKSECNQNKLSTRFSFLQAIAKGWDLYLIINS